MTIEQRKMFAEKILDLANIESGAIVFGQFVSGEDFSFLTLLLGMILAVILYYVAYRSSRVR
jgi:hypothetical protein